MASTNSSASFIERMASSSLAITSVGQRIVAEGIPCLDKDDCVMKASNPREHPIFWIAEIGDAANLLI
ncbi:hypothetical protein [Klebsiella pneumoniae]|uniref:hypothetical protein n=1 Tax=Klebsiella pneumoniae TaxID=573 RepID=UPI00159F1326|nr:hypothetical protein [Klebsiella pneumoniae]